MAVLPEELAESLKQRFRRQRAADEARSRALRAKLNALATTITANGSRRAWLIGSLAKGTWGGHSDVDVVVENASLTEERALQRTLETELDVVVDVLRFEELDGAFCARIVSEGVPFHVT